MMYLTAVPNPVDISLLQECGRARLFPSDETVTLVDQQPNLWMWYSLCRIQAQSRLVRVNRFLSRFSDVRNPRHNPSPLPTVTG